VSVTLANAPEDSLAFQAAVMENEGETAARVVVREHAGPDLVVEVDGHRLRAVALEVAPGQWTVRQLVADAETVELHWIAPLPQPGARSQPADALVAPMPGQVIALYVQTGQQVRGGDPLLALEAMKMEHTIRAPHDGVVAAIHCAVGRQVAAAEVLVDVVEARPLTQEDGDRHAP
jgi:3-methylcrotonyl-CoA carboxylase alpha subunit